MTQTTTPRSLLTHGITVPRRTGGAPRLRRATAALGYLLIPLIVLVTLWQIAAVAAASPFFPPPLAIAENLWVLLTAGGLAGPLGDFLATVGRMLLGFALGAAWGIVFGVLMGRNRVAKDALTPIVEFLRSVPATAALPLFITLLGGGDDMRVAFIAYGVSWFVLINTASGVGTIHPTMLEMGRVFQVSRSRQLFTVILPAAMPKIFAGLRIASTAALLLAIVSEFMLATNGIGYLLIQAQGRFQMLDMWSWMLALAILGLLINLLLERIEHHILAWHRLSRAKI